MLRATYQVARKLGYTVRALVAEIGWEELLTHVACEQLEQEAEGSRLARLAYYAGNAGRFKDLTLAKLCEEFGGAAVQEQTQTLSGFATLLETLGGEMPEEIRARFTVEGTDGGDGSDSNDPARRRLSHPGAGAEQGQ